MAGTREAADAAAEAQERDLRRVAYVEYFDALDAYATAEVSRFDSCVYDTDDRLVADVPCHPTLAEYQASEYAFHGEMNDMELIASDEALTLVRAIGPTVPPNFGPTSDVADSDPQSRRYETLYSTFLELAACDTSPNPRENCPSIRTYVQDVVQDRRWLRELLTGETDYDSSLTDELRDQLLSPSETPTPPDEAPPASD
jgi:hypothetical protein